MTNKYIFDKLNLGSIVLLLILVACSGGGGGGSPTTQQMGGAIQGVPLSLNNAVSTFAGAAPGADGIGAAARFNYPNGIASDGTNLYVADTYDNTIRKVVIATGVVTTLAGTASSLGGSVDGTGTAARFNGPTGITTNGTNLYVVDRNDATIRQIEIATGAVTTIAGTAGSFGSTNGTGANARFGEANSITTDGSSLYVADTSNHTIRKIVMATGEVTTLAGYAGTAGSADGTGPAARFNRPGYIYNYGGQALYVSDTGNHTIRRIDLSTGAVTSVAGTAGIPGATDGTGIAAQFSYPEGIGSDGINLYISDNGNRSIRKIVVATSAVTTIAGTVGVAGFADGTGSAARFNGPQGIVIDGNSLYLVDGGSTTIDYSNNTIRKIDMTNGAVTTLAGSALTSVDGNGAVAQFFLPYNVTTDGANLYVADTQNSTIRKIVIATGAVTTIAGTALVKGSADGTGATALFNYSQGIATDGTNLYVTDTPNQIIRKIVIATGVVTTLAGTTGMAGYADGIGSAAQFNNPAGITTDGANLYVADNGNNIIRKIVIVTGEVTTLAGTTSGGSADGVGTLAEFISPVDITTDGTNLYVTDNGNQTIRKIVIATGAVTTLAGTVGVRGSVDDTGAAAQFDYPYGITSDGSNLYVTDSQNYTIRMIVIATGAVTTLAGTAPISGSADGAGAAARFSEFYGITTDGHSLYIADTYNSTIRRLQ